MISGFSSRRLRRRNAAGRANFCLPDSLARSVTYGYDDMAGISSAETKHLFER